MLMVDGHSRNAILAGKFDNGDIKENRYDTRGKLGEHFAGAVEAGLDKVPFVPVEFGKFQVCFVEFKINQTISVEMAIEVIVEIEAPKTPQPKTTIV